MVVQQYFSTIITVSIYFQYYLKRNSFSNKKLLYILFLPLLLKPKQKTMSNLNNQPAVVNPNPVVQQKVVQQKVVQQKVKVVSTGFRPLPQVDQNQLHYIYDPVNPVYPGQNILAQNQPINIGYNNQVVGQVPASQKAGMVREQGYVEKTTTIKQTIKAPIVQ